MTTELTLDELAHNVSLDWMQNSDHLNQEELEACVASFAMKLATTFEVLFGDDAVVSLADVLRTSADAVEERLGEFIQKDRKRVGT